MTVPILSGGNLSPKGTVTCPMSQQVNAQVDSQTQSALLLNLTEPHQTQRQRENYLYCV